VGLITLHRALRLGDAPQVAFVGAGGKSSALFAFARQFDRPVIVTTSTHFAVEQLKLADRHLVVGHVSDIEKISAENFPAVTVMTGPEINDGRVSGLDAQSISALGAFARSHSLPLLIEADGARRRALKAPAAHEPAIPPFADAVIVVTGLSALGKPLNEEWVHRPERFAAISGLKIGDLISPNAIAKVLLDADGGLKNIPAKARRVVLLNQAETPELEGAARGLAQNLLAAFDAVWVGAVQRASDLTAVIEPVAGILLAAGDSQRLGRSKQLLDWKGKPFVRQVAETALAAGLEPLLVVTGADSQPTETALAGLPLWIVRNPNWRDGQSSSVMAGLVALPNRVGAAIFLVADQPQLPVALIEALRAEHASSLAPIVAPLVDGHRSNPVLFDRSTFADFTTLEGDVGGRAIFSKHRVTWLPWLDASLAIDVDTLEDYDKLLRQAG
jgi:molybdenum cofactor cytidylyltransferase